MPGVGGEGNDALERHLEWLLLKGLAASTVRRRRVVLGWVAASLDCTLLEASPGQLQAWRAALTVAPDAVSVYVSHVHQFYRWAVDQGLLRGSPAAALPAPRRGRRLPRPIGETELLAALAAAPPRVRPMLVLAGWAGLRAKEIALLRREYVLDTRVPAVLLIASDATKGYAERIVPMSAFVLGELRPVLPARGWVFLRFDGRPGPNSPANVSHLANVHLHDCGIAETLHQLRHRFATGLYQASGGDLRLVQEVLGHSTPATTAGYAAYDPAAAAAAVEAIPAPVTRKLRACS
jgi:integrase/recombinase XerC